MKIVLTLDEVKNIVANFVHEHQGGEKPKEVMFIHRFYDNSGEADVNSVALIDRVEITL